MEKTKDNTHRAKPRSSCFMGCFGFSEKVAEKKKPVSSEHRQKIAPFSWSRLRMKKSDVKTVPVDSAVSEKANKRRLIISVMKSYSKHHFPATGKTPADVADEVVKQKSDKTKSEIAHQIILEVPNNQDDMEPQESATCRQRSSSGLKVEATTVAAPTVHSSPSSPEKMLNLSGRGTALSHSLSLPVTAQKKKVAETGRKPAKLASVEEKGKRGGAAGKIDPVVGVSIIVVTLIIMLIWGRLCAILCTSAWLYFVPQLGLTTSYRGASPELCGPSEVDDKKKQKVVLEGFLERKKHLRKAKSSL